MQPFWLSALLVIGANVTYHVCQKSIPLTAHVIVSIIVTFLVAILLSIPLLIFFPMEGHILSVAKGVGWASVSRGLAIIGIEVGYLLLYRSGWHISLGALFCNTWVFLLLLPVGFLLFKEKLVLSHYFGILLALGGIYLMTRGR